jgi:hypothetical protein
VYNNFWIWENKVAVQRILKLDDRASETYMVQAASVEDSLSNLEGTEDFQNSKTKQRQNKLP